MIIKKRISFDFLGEEYKDAYGVFASIPITEYPEIANTVDKEGNSIKKGQLMLAIVKKKFLSGEWPDDDGKLQPLKAEELDGADGDLLLTVYNRLMGGADPKGLPPSETTSPTAETPPTNT